LLLSKIRLLLHYHTNNIIDIQNIIKMTKLQLIKKNLSPAIRIIVTTEELDATFDKITNEYLLSEYTAPFTSVEIQAAQRLALKEMILTIKK